MKLKLMGKFLRFVLGGNVLAITLCPFGIYFRDTEIMNNKEILNHESIHWKQQLEMLIIFFYIWYIIEWFIRIFINGKLMAYRLISFEQESYDNAKNMSYINTRKHFSWFKYIGKDIWKF